MKDRADLVAVFLCVETRTFWTHIDLQHLIRCRLDRDKKTPTTMLKAFALFSWGKLFLSFHFFLLRFLQVLQAFLKFRFLSFSICFRGLFSGHLSF